MAEISAVRQKFLDQNIQNFIPQLSYIHHFFLWGSLSSGKSQNKEFRGKWQKFLAYSGNFYVRICASTFCINSTLTVCVSETDFGWNQAILGLRRNFCRMQEISASKYLQGPAWHVLQSRILQIMPTFWKIRDFISLELQNDLFGKYKKCKITMLSIMLMFYSTNANCSTFLTNFELPKKITVDEIACISHPSGLFMKIIFSWNRALVTLSIPTNSNLVNILISVTKSKISNLHLLLGHLIVKYHTIHKVPYNYGPSSSATYRT